MATTSHPQSAPTLSRDVPLSTAAALHLQELDPLQRLRLDTAVMMLVDYLMSVSKDPSAHGVSGEKSML